VRGIEQASHEARLFIGTAHFKRDGVVDDLEPRCRDGALRREAIRAHEAPGAEVGASVVAHDGGDGVGQRRAFEGAEDRLAGGARRLAGVGGARRRAVARAELPGERDVRRVVVLAPQPLQHLVRLLRRRDALHEPEEPRGFLPHIAAARAGRHAPRIVVRGHSESVDS
jgi:hypothetical protein